MNPRPIVVCEASPRAPTVTVRCVRVGNHLVKVLTDTTWCRGRFGFFPDVTAALEAPRER